MKECQPEKEMGREIMLKYVQQGKFCRFTSAWHLRDHSEDIRRRKGKYTCESKLKMLENGVGGWRPGAEETELPDLTA